METNCFSFKVKSGLQQQLHFHFAVTVQQIFKTPAPSLAETFSNEVQSSELLSFLKKAVLKLLEEMCCVDIQQNHYGISVLTLFSRVFFLSFRIIV